MIFYGTYLFLRLSEATLDVYSIYSDRIFFKDTSLSDKGSLLRYCDFNDAITLRVKLVYRYSINISMSKTNLSVKIITK